MSETYSQLVSEAGNTGKKVRLLENTISGQVVEQQVVSLGDSAGVLLEQEVQGLPVKHLMMASTTAAITGTGSTALSVKGFAGVVVSITGTYTATFFHEISDDGGGTYFAVRAMRLDSGMPETTPGQLVNVTRQWLIPVAGASHYRFRCSAYTSGTANLRITPTTAVLPDPGDMETASKQRDTGLANAVTAIKTTGGRLKALQVCNNQGAAAYIQIFDVASGSVILGTTTPDWEGLVAATSQKEFAWPGKGLPFSTAISICATTTSKGATGSNAGVHTYWQIL